jgi:phage tail sheath protein FI
MPFNYSSPGVYIEEVSKGGRPISSASTSVLAMIGMCRQTILIDEPGKGVVTKATPATPTLVTNWSQFTAAYGDFDQAVPGGFLHHSMYGFFQNGGTAAYIVGLPVAVSAKEESAPPPKVPASEGFLLNAGGGRTLRIATTGPLKPGEEVSVEVQPAPEGAPEGTFNLLVRRSGAEPRTIVGLGVNKGVRGQRNIVDVLTRETDNLLLAELLERPDSQAAERLPALGSKTTLTAPAPSATNLPATTGAVNLAQKVTPNLFQGNAAERTGIAGLEAIEEITMLACPDVVAAYAQGAISEEEVKSVQLAMLNHCEAMKDRFAILDCPPGLNAQAIRDWRMNRMNFDSQYGALYYPWIKINGRLAPPSGHLAGLYSRVDSQRGIHKAPANEIVNGAIGLEINISRNEQDLLNPVGINCIRAFPGQGIRVWGARTLSSNAEWRYINVRRLFCNIEKSILQGTNWIVFEPNNQLLWRAIRRDITSYLTTVWSSGALFGQTPEEAFYVKCDEETNPPEVRDLGYCIVEVGLAPVKPAEFVVFRVSQKRDGSGESNE